MKQEMYPPRVNITPRPYDDTRYHGISQTLLSSAEIDGDHTAHWCYAHPTQGPAGGYYTLCGLYTPHNTRNPGNLLYCPPCNQRYNRLAMIALYQELHAEQTRGT